MHQGKVMRASFKKIIESDDNLPIWEKGQSEQPTKPLIYQHHARFVLGISGEPPKWNPPNKESKARGKGVGRGRGRGRGYNRFDEAQAPGKSKR